MLSRLLHGGQVSLLVGIGATAIGFSIGLVLGTTAGFYGGAVEAGLMRIFDVLFAFPGLILALAIAAFLGPSVWHTIWAISFFSLAGFGRLARGQTIRVRNYDYVVAQRPAARRHGRSSSVTSSRTSCRRFLPSRCSASAARWSQRRRSAFSASASRFPNQVGAI